MTPEQALELLNKLRLHVEMKWADHELALKAYQTLKEFVDANTPKPST